MPNETDTASAVTALTAKARTIDGALAHLTKVEKELMTGTDGGGRMLAYLENGKARFITATVGLSGGKTTQRYYYENGTLFHISEIRQDFERDSESGSVDATKIAKTTERTFFFADGKLIHASAGANADAADLLNEGTVFADAAKSSEKIVDVSSLLH